MAIDRSNRAPAPHEHQGLAAPLSEDTAPDIEHLQLEIFRRMAAAQKISVVNAGFEQSRQLAFAGLRRRHPDADDRELLRRFVALMHGDDLARRAYSRDEEVDE